MLGVEYSVLSCYRSLNRGAKNPPNCCKRSLWLQPKVESHFTRKQGLLSIQKNPADDMDSSLIVAMLFTVSELGRSPSMKILTDCCGSTAAIEILKHTTLTGRKNSYHLNTSLPVALLYNANHVD